MTTSVGVTLRSLTVQDSISDLTALLHRAYAPLAERGMRYVASDQSEELTRDRIGTGECLLAVLDDGKVVGAVTLTPAGDASPVEHYRRSGVGHFSQLAVEPEFQGNGIGAQLMDAVERRARELGLTDLALDTSQFATELVSMYMRRGYEIVGSFDWPETNYQSLVMNLEL